MILNEVMNRPVPYRLHSKQGGEFDIGDKHYDVIFEPPEDYEDPGEPTFVTFELTSPATNNVSILSKSNTGDEFSVFATVLAMIDDYTAQYAPSGITFSVDMAEPSRAKLYDRMVKRFDHKWHVSTSMIGTIVKVYTLTAKGKP